MKKAIVIGLTGLLLIALAYSQRSNYRTVDVGNKSPMFAVKDHVVLLNFWATWCIPCRKEMPALERVQQEFGNKGLIVIGVSADDKESDARQYAEALGLTFRIVHDATDSIQTKYQVQGLPTTFVIDKKGRIVERALGPRAWDDSAHASKFEKLLAE